MNGEILTPFLEATIRTATPLAFAALGETVSQRAGVVNIGLEGSIIAGCLAAAVWAQFGGVAAGLLLGLSAGIVVAAVFAWFALSLRSDQIITGTAITVGAYGATGTLSLAAFGSGGAALNIATLRSYPVPILVNIPWIGPALFNQPATTYILYLLVPVVWWWMYRTHAGLGLRAIGEQPRAAIAAGIPVSSLRWFAVLASGAGGGLAGATLVLAQVGTFNEQMSAGRGFIALAIVALGRWNPAGAFAGALLYGAASAIQFRFQTMGADLPYQLFLALPYVLTLIVLASGVFRSRAPESLGHLVD
jgi:simple sugar transport system permease protein